MPGKRRGNQSTLISQGAGSRWATGSGAASISPTHPPSYPAGLTSREVEVLRLLAQGCTGTQIAEQLTISHRTVTTHLTSIYNKLGVNLRVAATRFALEHHLA